MIFPSKKYKINRDLIMKHCGTEILNGPNIAMDTSYAMVTSDYNLYPYYAGNL